MLGMTYTARGNGRARLRSSVALALALAGGAVVGTAALSSPALAQREQRQQQQQGQTLSRNFQPVYQAVSNAVTTGTDLPAARAQVPALIAAIASEYDRFFAGNIMLQLGAKSNDKALQKQGLELMLASGQGTPADIGLFRYFLGGFAYDAGDYAGALREGQASLAAGFAGNFTEQQDPWLLVADSQIKLGRQQEALAFLKSAMEQRAAAQQPVRDVWLQRSLAIAYEQRLAPDVAELSALLIKTSPTANNWQQALQTVGALSTDAQDRLDILRLMALTDTLTQRGEYETYVGVLDPRVLASEAGRVLAKGLEKGVFTASDPFYADNKRVIDTRAGGEAALAAEFAAEANSSSSGKAAFDAGDVYLSLGQYAQAERMFGLALQKGGVDRDKALTRTGIAQVQQNKLAEAKATFGQVSGQGAAVARLWNAYVDTKA